MWPTLISIGPVSLHSFGVILFFGLFFGSFSLWRRSRDEGWDEAVVLDAWLLAGAAALICGRFGYLAANWAEFNASWYKILFFTKFPGLSVLGAWVGAVAVLLVTAWRKRLPVWIWLEAVIPALLVVEIFGHAASFFSGGNLGRPAPAGWGLVFPGVPEARWPEQLIWVLGLVLVYGLVRYWEKHYRSFGWKEGFLTAVYLIGSGSLRLGLSFLTEVPGGLTRWWAAALIIGGGLILVNRSSITIKVPVKRKRRFDYA